MTDEIKDRRFTTIQSDQYDPSKLLTRGALLFVGILILFICTIIGFQIIDAGSANTESWSALTGLIGWATSQVSIIFSNRYGTTQQSAGKDAVIAQQARTAAVISGTGSGAPIKTRDVNIDATDADIEISNPMKTDAQKMMEARKAVKEPEVK